MAIEGSLGPGTENPTAPYYVKALALGIPAYLLGVHLWTWVLYLPLFLGGRADFRQLYVGAYMLRSGHAHELYDYTAQKQFEDTLVSRAQSALPVNHLAYEELLFVPFSYLNFTAAYAAFLALNLVLLTAGYRLIRPWMGNLAAIYWWLPAVMFLAFLPIAATLIQGQDSILLLTLLAVASGLLKSGREFRAGILVAFGLFKFQIVVPIALLFLLWRRWRFFAGFAVSATGLLSVSLFLVGPAQGKVYLRSLLSMSIGLSSLADQLRYGISPAFMPNLRGLIFGMASERLPAISVQVVTFFASFVVFSLVVMFGRRVPTAFDAFLIAIATSAVVSYHLLIHDLSVLLIPIVVMLDRFIAAEATGDQAGRLITRTSALMFVAPVCISFTPTYFFFIAVPICMFLVVLLSWHSGVLDHDPFNVTQRSAATAVSLRDGISRQINTIQTTLDCSKNRCR
jgi:hypothetical protein